jgi:hypothetical protein
MSNIQTNRQYRRSGRRPTATADRHVMHPKTITLTVAYKVRYIVHYISEVIHAKTKNK